jgi:retron-type reverse transcriptase
MWTRATRENEKFRHQFIETLQKELKAHTFKPMPVRRVEIPKPGTNKKRPLGIPTLKDRTVQTLLKMLMEPIWEADFFYFSNGFRVGTLHHGLYSALVQTVQYHNRRPMGDRGRHQGVFRPHPARQVSRLRWRGELLIHTSLNS